MCARKTLAETNETSAPPARTGSDVVELEQPLAGWRGKCGTREYVPAQRRGIETQRFIGLERITHDCAGVGTIGDTRPGNESALEIVEEHRCGNGTWGRTHE
jgi:hypothetical protein